ncbi:LPFR motif small protein [Streptomonospora sp. PA3]|nr:LPFR motif small protein [Streptomonospora sp. PA3]
MSRIADVLRTIANAIASVIGAIAHAVVTVVTLPFRALAKLFRKR